MTLSVNNDPWKHRHTSVTTEVDHTILKLNGSQHEEIDFVQIKEFSWNKL